MKKNRYIKVTGLLFFAVSMLIMGLAVFLPRLIDVNAYRNEIIASARQSLGREIFFKSGLFSMRYGPSFIFDTVTVRERGSDQNFLEAEKMTLHLAILPLFERRIEFRELSLEKPKINLTRNANGELNCDDILNSPGSEPLRVRNFSMKQGEVSWRDYYIRPEGVSLEIKDIDLSLHNLHRGKHGNFTISARLASAAEEQATVSLKGSARVPEAEKSLFETTLSADLTVKKAPLSKFWPYFGGYIPFPDTGGKVDLVTKFRGKLSEFRAKGKLSLSGVAVNWPAVFHHPVNPRAASLDYELALDKNSIDMPSLAFSADGFRIHGSCKVSGYAGGDPLISAKASSDPFQLENLRQWIPYGIIADDASNYIEEHITGGLFRLETGTLNGKASQIASMEKGENYNVLHIKGVVERGVVSYGSGVPSFSNIKGGLEMLGKDFILSNVTGSFGKSPFSMSGRITGYPLLSPCQYPFRMQITPHRDDVAWLARIAGAEKLEFDGASELALTGSGALSAYNLTGEWDMGQASYAFPRAVRKQAGIASRIAFSARLGREETRLTSLTYTLASIMISASADFNYSGKPYLAFEMQTKPFLMSEAVPILPGLRKYKLSGKVAAHITGRGNPADFTTMDYRGAINLSSFSFAPGHGIKPVSNIEGRISFAGNSLETSSIDIIYGRSKIAVRGRVRNLANPEAELALSSQELFLRDVSDSFAGSDAAIKNMQATFGMDNGIYLLHDFSGQLGSSSFAMDGVCDTVKRTADISLNTSDMNLEEVLALAGEGKKEEKTGDPPYRIKISLTAEKGSYGKIAFSRVKAELEKGDRTLDLRSLEAHLYDGNIVASGSMARDAKGEALYETSFYLEKINAGKFFDSLGISREVTGSMNLKGSLAGAGGSMPEFRRSLSGNLDLRLEKGSIRKFSVLSKIFSILNLSQLLKFQLPDMVSGGMPYNKIKGNIAIKNGVASTKNLVISGDAINISIIGDADVAKEELDLVIGVKPLQTVDKIVNRIPIVGWILTGEENSVITAYFEAKGSWNDPEVNTIQAESMAKGIMNIFQRILKLPVKLFTDTGEVMLGK